MRPRESFGVGVRIVGLIVVLVSILYFVSGVVVLIDPKFQPKVSPAWHYFVDAVVELAVGLYLLRGATQIVRFAYPGCDSESCMKSDAQQSAPREPPPRSSAPDAVDQRTLDSPPVSGSGGGR